MKTFTIDGELRTEVGKKASKADRRAGKIPCVLYGGNEETIHFSTTSAQLRNLIYTPNFYKVEIKIDGKVYEALMKDLAFHPVSDEVLHVDFQQLLPGIAVNTEIPVKVIGTSPGVRLGGQLLVKVRKLRVKVTPEALKDEIEINVSKLKLGHSIKVKDLPEQGFEIVNAPNVPIVSVDIPRALRGGDVDDIDADEEEEGEEGGEEKAGSEE
ncbi:MAG TPA: 50S ribosomal protein L25/general stress protein Ctc [Chitinophagales bacterium]|nr:50S ribosomal protein L25/general stress protein Ctc [Chitinophagales bacterium]